MFDDMKSSNQTDLPALGGATTVPPPTAADMWLPSGPTKAAFDPGPWITVPCSEGPMSPTPRWPAWTAAKAVQKNKACKNIECCLHWNFLNHFGIHSELYWFFLYLWVGFYDKVKINQTHIFYFFMC